MARKLKEGSELRRVRIRTPGWRGGVFDKHLGRADKRTYARWRVFIEEAHRQGFYDVLDAVADGTVTAAEAYTESTKGGAGHMGARQYIKELKAARAAAASAGDFEVWLDEFLEVKPRHAAAKQYRLIEAVIRRVLAFIARRHNLPGAGAVTVDLWTKDNLRAYVAWYIEAKHAETAARLEARWAKGQRPAKAECDEILRRDRGSKGSTANRHVNLIGSFSAWLIEGDRLTQDPSVGVRISSRSEGLHRTDDHRSIEKDELTALLTVSQEIDTGNMARPGALWWQWLVASGATTYTEATRLRPVDIRMREESDGTVPVKIHPSKATARTRDIYLPTELAKRILDRGKAMKCGRSGLIFAFTESQGRIAWDSLMAAIAERDPEMGRQMEGATPYDLRHTFAVNALRAGVDIMELSRLMGHADISTTAIYLRHTSSARSRLRIAFEGSGLV